MISKNSSEKLQQRKSKVSSKMSVGKILEFYQDLGVNEVISEKPVNRLKEQTQEIKALISLPQNQEKKQVAISTQNLIVNNFGNMTQTEAISRLAQRQSGNNPVNEIKSIADIVKNAQVIVDQIQNLADLEKAVRNFDGCNLKKMATNTVFSDGNPKAKIMIIGEAPGNHEDLQGIPFCGDSGKLLDQMFLAINKSRANELYITNTLFWRPPGNRRPTDDELAMCRPFVERHIGLIKPNLIVLMGATAMSSVLGINDPISKIRGKFLDYKNQYLAKSIATISLFHPSYLMRQPGKKKLAWKDLTLIDDFLKNFS